MADRDFTVRAVGDQIEIRVTRYGARYWAVYLNEQLLAVTVYKKGARAVQAVISRLTRLAMPNDSGEDDVKFGSQSR